MLIMCCHLSARATGIVYNGLTSLCQDDAAKQKISWELESVKGLDANTILDNFADNMDLARAAAVRYDQCRDTSPGSQLGHALQSSKNIYTGYKRKYLDG